MPMVYDELRQLAERALRRERPDHTLSTTALVHEAYLRLVDQTRVQWQHRGQFLGVAAQMMRRILVDHARRRATVKRGGLQPEVRLSAIGDGASAAASEPTVDVPALDDALNRLAAFDPQQARIVELRFFGGLTLDETAQVCDISVATVKRDWTLAKAWLYRELQESGGR